jgi:hypothetical protein
MKFIFTFVLSFLCLNCIGQSQTTIDSLVDKICVSINESKSDDDSTKVISAFEKHLYLFFENVPEPERETLLNRIVLRLQAKCKSYSDISLKIPKNQNWIAVSEVPVSKLSSASCEEFFKIHKFKYVELSGDTTQLKIETGFWIDDLADGTYSKLKFTKTAQCEFEISFLESNNKLKGPYSKVGDRYLYRVLEKGVNSYLLCVTNATSNASYLHKLYY